MRQATAIVLFVMLAVTQVASFDALPSLWSEYYRNALYRNSAARLQQASQQCLVEDAPATIACQSARLTTGGRNTFVHVCPDRGDPQGVCYNSKLARCCPLDVERGVLKCVSATKLTVGGQQVTVAIYDLAPASPGHCIYFQSQSASSIQSCCLGADEQLPCAPNPPVTTPPPPPTTTTTPTPPPCVPKRDIYFILDATQSVGSDIFCTFGYVIQLIEAAMNPSGGSEGARVSTILFEYQVSQTVRYKEPRLFNLGDSCNTVVKTNIPRVVYEYRGVEEEKLFHNKPGDLTYPQVGATNTQPYSALSKAFDDITAYSKGRPATVIILTDGKPQQDVSSIIKDLKGVTADLIAAGIGSSNDINQAVLETLASSPADVIYEEDLGNVVSFAMRIVERMRVTAALCLDQANRILDSLKSTNVVNLGKYCNECMFTATPSDSCKTTKFPQCGAQNLQMQAFDESDFESVKLDNKAFSSEELKKLILEEQILAEVEEIMEMGEHRKQQQVEEDTISHGSLAVIQMFNN